MSTYNKSVDYLIIALTASMRGNERLARKAFKKVLSNRRLLAEAIEDMNDAQEEKVEEVEDMPIDDDDDDDDSDLDDLGDVASSYRRSRRSRSLRASNRARRRIFSMEDDIDMGGDDMPDKLPELDDDDDEDDDDMGGVAESNFRRRGRRVSSSRRGRRSSLVSVESRLIRGNRDRRSSSRNSRLGRIARNLSSL